MNGQVNYADIFKKNFLQMGSLTDSSVLGVLVTMVAALIVGLYIFWIYRACYRGVIYSHSFNVSIMLMVLITSMIILTISSNIVLSLGMVGALSIVRFRTAIKDPMDLVFLFWSVAAGIGVGARLYSVVVIGSILIGLTFLILSRFKNQNKVYLLVINYDDDVNSEVRTIINFMKYVIRSKSSKGGKTELTVELTIRDDNTSFVNMLSSTTGVHNVVLVSYSGDFAE